MRKTRIVVAAAALLAGVVLARGGGVPPMPNQPPFNDPSLQLNNMQMLIQQLNGFPAYAPAANMGIGQYCTASGTGTQTCNGQRGAITYTSGITPTTTGTNQTISINNSFVTAQSVCFAQWNSAFTAGSAMAVATVTPSAGALSVVTVNAGTTANAVATGTLGFNCAN